MNMVYENNGFGSIPYPNYTSYQIYSEYVQGLRSKFCLVASTGNEYLKAMKATFYGHVEVRRISFSAIYIPYNEITFYNKYCACANKIVKNSENMADIGELKVMKKLQGDGYMSSYGVFF